MLPGGAIPVAGLLSQLERDTHEYVVDPWVVDRATVVGIERDRVVAAAHLKRYGADARVSASYHDAGEVAWLVSDPKEGQAGEAVLGAATDQLRRWGSRVWYGDGSLPCLGVYGIPDAWPHVRALLEGAGFDDRGGQIEVVFAGDLAAVPPPGPSPLAALELRRVVGGLGTSFEVHLDGRRVGVFEVQDTYGVGNNHLQRWADQGSHWVAPDLRGRGVGSWLFRTGCAWLRLAGKDRLLAYAVERHGGDAEPHEPGPGIEACERYYARHGLGRVARTRRGWTRRPD